MYKDNKTMKKTAWGLLIALLTFSLPLSSQAQSDAEVATIVQICKNIPGISARLNCYDNAFPPPVQTIDLPETVEVVEAVPANEPEPMDSNSSLPTREELVETVAELEQRLQTQVIEDNNSNMVRIVEVEKPSLRTSRLVSADGRVFLQTNSRSVTPWPETPFEIELTTGRMGATYLILYTNNERQRIRVMQEE